MNIKTILVTAVSTILIATAGIAGAQDTTTPADNEGRSSIFQRGDRGMRGEFQALVEQYTGLEGTAIAEALRNGDTIATLITANNGDVNAFIDEAVALSQANIDAAVEEGRISEERAARMTENLRAGIETRVNGEYPLLERRGGRGGEGRGMLRDSEMIALVEQYTGLESTAIAEAVRSGDTIADLITANNGDVNAFITEATALAQANIDERAEERKANAEESITAWINGERPQRRGNNN